MVQMTGMFKLTKHPSGVSQHRTSEQELIWTNGHSPNKQVKYTGLICNIASLFYHQGTVIKIMIQVTGDVSMSDFQN